MGFVLLAICMGVLPASIAQSKGRNFLAWWIYGAALFIIALPHSLLIKPDTQRIKQEQLQFGDARHQQQHSFEGGNTSFRIGNKIR
jgi:hypothetical protein